MGLCSCLWERLDWGGKTNSLWVVPFPRQASLDFTGAEEANWVPAICVFMALFLITDVTKTTSSSSRCCCDFPTVRDYNKELLAKGSPRSLSPLHCFVKSILSHQSERNWGTEGRNCYWSQRLPSATVGGKQIKLTYKFKLRLSRCKFYRCQAPWLYW